MSLISCTDPCVYQQDGLCTLSRAASCGAPGAQARCVNFVPRLAASENRAQGLADVAHPDHLQPLRDGQPVAAPLRDETLGKA